MMRKKLVAIVAGLMVASCTSALADFSGINLVVDDKKNIQSENAVYLASYTRDKTPYQLSDVGDRFTAALLPPMSAGDEKIMVRPKVSDDLLLEGLLQLQRTEQEKHATQVKLGAESAVKGNVEATPSEAVKEVADATKSTAQVEAKSKDTGDGVAWNPTLRTLMKDATLWDNLGKFATSYEGEKKKAEETVQFTRRGISTGSSRGELLFAYGSPAAIWRTQMGGKYVFLYVIPPQAEVEYSYGDTPVFWATEQERAVAGTERNSSYAPDLKSKRAKGESYLAFTIEGEKIIRIDSFSAEEEAAAHLPAISAEQFIPNHLVDRDFSFQGYRLHEKLKAYEANDWQMTGEFLHHTAVQYHHVFVLTDADSVITSVISANSYGVTARGMAMGDSKLLMLFVYGKPTYLYQDVVEKDLLNVDKTAVDYYVYARTQNPYEYLVFSVGKEDGFIKQITLTNRVTEKVG